MTSLLLFFFISFFFCPIISYCPLPPRIRTPNVHRIVQTRQVVQLPDSKIISIKPFPNSQTDLAVCTLTKIYRVNTQTRSYSLFFDVERAIDIATDRELNYENRQHGGLRSVAFHPQYSANGLFYISAMEDRPSQPRKFKYISDSSRIRADSVLIEFRSTKGVPNPNSYRLLFRVGMRVFDHPIKQIEFYGKYLYIAHGDGSEQSATAGGGQRGDALGKILRINPLKSNGLPYTIPKENVFKKGNSKGMPPEVFAYGFRNPHHISFSQRGRLFVADAGRDNREEINLVENGKNYGWSEREGTCVHYSGGGIQNGVGKIGDAPDGYVYPVAEYEHKGPNGKGFIGVAIAGGCPIENGSGMSGKYWYADFPKSGTLFYSMLKDMYAAKTQGPRDTLKQAKIYNVKIQYNGKVYNNLHDVMASESRYRHSDRVDVRMGRGSKGELYWSSKTSGKLFVFTSSIA